MSAATKLTVSVVIPAYNEEAYLGQCLDSLLAQTVPPDEIIVVDNNSRDATGNIARQFKGVKVISEKEQGIVHARNAGFDAAQSDIIARCDADSILPKTWVKQIRDSFARGDIAAISGPCTFYDLPKQLSHFKAALKSSHTLVYFKGSKAMLGHEVLFGSNMAITQDIWHRVRDQVCLDETKMHEDTDLSVHIAATGGIIKFDPKLQAAISARRRPDTVQAKSSLPELISYISRWTNTKLSHPAISKASDHEN